MFRSIKETRCPKQVATWKIKDGHGPGRAGRKGHGQEWGFILKAMVADDGARGLRERSDQF